MAPTSKFSGGEKVLCFHGPLLYEAKILKLQTKNGRFTYFVHYSGWNKNWDEWVNELRMLEINEKNLKRQKELADSILAAKKNKTPKSGQKKGTPTEKKTALHSGKNSSTHTVTKSVKPKTLVVIPAVSRASRKITRSHPEEPSEMVVATSAITAIKSEYCETDPEEQDECSIVAIRKIPVSQKKIQTSFEEDTKTTDEEPPPKIVLTLPHNLKCCLIDDFAMINHKKRPSFLPARISIDDLIAQYQNIKSEEGLSINKKTTIKEVCNGIQFYFNFILRKRLLYAFEKLQFQDLIAQNPDKLMSQLYGPIHLLRLLEKICWMLSYTCLDQEGVDLLTKQFADFINFLSESQDKYFDFSEYTDAPSEHSEPVSS